MRPHKRDKHDASPYQSEHARQDAKEVAQSSPKLRITVAARIDLRAPFRQHGMIYAENKFDRAVRDIDTSTLKHTLKKSRTLAEQGQVRAQYKRV